MNPRALKKASNFVSGAIKRGGMTVSEGERTAFKLLYPNLAGPDTARTLWKNEYRQARYRAKKATGANLASPSGIEKFVGDFRNVDKDTTKQFLRGQRMRARAAEKIKRGEYQKDFVRAGGVVFTDRPPKPKASWPKEIQRMVEDQNLRYDATQRAKALAKSTHQAKYPAKHQWFEHHFSELSPTAKAVWRHYYGKLKKFTRNGKLSGGLDKYLPGHHDSPSKMLFRGTNKAEVEKLAAGRFKSNWQHAAKDAFPNKLTWVASNPRMAAGYAVGKADPRMVVVAPTALKRRDRGVSSMVGATTTTAPLRGGIGLREVRGLLKGENHAVERWFRRGGPESKKWRPVPLGEIQRKEFSVHEFATITRLRDRVAFVKSLRRQLEKRATGEGSSHSIEGIRAVFAPDGRNKAISWTTSGTKRLPRAVKVDGQPAILHYRGSATDKQLKRPITNPAEWAGDGKVQIVLPKMKQPSYWRQKFKEPRLKDSPSVRKWSAQRRQAYAHVTGSDHPTGLISTTVSKPMAADWAVSHANANAIGGKGKPKEGVLGIYATKARDLLRSNRKAAMVNTIPSEREISQSTGGNLILRRRLKVVPQSEHGGYSDIRRFTRIDRGRVEMSQPIGYEGGVPLTGRIARDRWVKKLRDEDLDRRDANLGRAGAAGAIAGALFPSRKLGLYKRMGIGAVAGTAGVLGVRQATKNSRDAYGERSRGAKRAESVPAAAGLTAAGLLGAKKLGLLKRLKFSVGSSQSSVEFEKPFHGYNSKRHAKTGGLNDNFRKKYNREHGSNLKRPVTTEPSKLKPGSKAAKRRASFCARMGGMQGPTSKDGKLTPKGAALKRWNCSAQISSVQFSKKEKKGLNPYVGATASGAISGAGLGFIPTILRRGSSLKSALKAGAVGGALSGAIVGGGALLGSRILGDPREDEGSAFTKRAAIGGTIAGAGAGLAGGILLRKTRTGARALVGASKNWRPAQWLRKSPVAGSAAIGAVGGAIYGGATGADEGQQVDSIRHLRKDLRKDVKAAAMKLERKVGSLQLAVGSGQKDWRDARRESRSEAAKDVMTGGGALAAGVGVGGGALWAARKFGQNADKAGAAAEQVTSTLKGVTKPRFVRSRQWLKKQMSFPTFGKVMKKFRMSSTAEAVELARYDKMAVLRKIGKPTEQLKAVVAKENARQPSWNRGLKNKLRNALDMLALESKSGVHSFQLAVDGQYRRPMTEEQRKVRNVLVAGTVGVGVAGGTAAVGLRSLKKADEAMRGARVWNRPRYSRAFEPLPGMTTPKKNLTATMQDKWNAAKARAAMSAQGSGKPIRIDAPQAMARQAEARRIKEVRAVSRAPIADAVAGSRASTKARIAQGRKLQKIASVGNAGVLSRGERLAAAGALTALRKKFRFEHHFAMPYRDKDGKAAGVGTWLRGDQIYDTEMNPTSMGVGTLANKMSRYSQQGWRETRRGANLMRDFREVARGEKTKKREWEKSYFKDRVAGALGTAGLIAGAVVYRKGGKYGAPKWAQKWHGAVNKVGGGIKRANTTASDWLNKQVNGFAARGSRAIEFADPRNRMEKARDGIADGLGYIYTAGGGAGAGAVAGRLLAGARKPALIAGAALGAAAGVGLRKSYGERITANRKARAEKQNTQPWQAWKHENKAEVLNLAPAALGLAGGALLLKASPKILSASNRYGNRFRQWRGRMGAKMPVSKATQDARFAKAKPARAWEVGGSQAAPSNWPRLAMESRMNATLRMFEGSFGYGDYYAAPGWDLRDARGNSARVFAPGAKKRVRRAAEWHEKKDNQKKLIAGAGLAGALLAGGGGLYLGRLRGIKVGKAMKEAEAIKNIVKFPKQSVN